MTPPQADRLFATMVTSADRDAAIRPLLASSNVTERILASAALLAGSGLTAELRALAIKDPSPYVRAEIVARLLIAGQSADIQAVRDDAARAASKEQAQSLILLLASEPAPEVPVAMHRLGLGQSLLPYVALMAMSSDVVLAALVDSMADANLPIDGKKRLLNAYTLAQPSDYPARLRALLGVEQPLAIRSVAAARIAASMSEADTRGRTALIETLGTSAPQAVAAALPSREALRSEIRAIETELAELVGAASPSLTEVQQTLATYLEVCRMAGGNGGSDAIVAALRTISDRRLPIPVPVLAEAHVIALGPP